MKTTTRSVLAGAGASTACAFVLVVLANSVSKAAPQPPQQALIERGYYLVHRVGLCIDCHSPRNERGEFLAGRDLTGAPIPFKPLVEMPWVPAAPRIAGLPDGFSADDMVHFLMTGKRPGGRPAALPPMPPYRMNREDAEAVVAYLRTLPTGIK